MFSWPIDGSSRQWFCPALNSVLVTSNADVAQSLLESQIRSMLQRTTDKLQFEDISTLFWNRQFYIEELTRLTPLQIEECYHPTKPGPRTKGLKTVRSVATKVVTWQHTRTHEQHANVTRLIRCLDASRPQSVLLVGPSGVGKTAIVYEYGQLHPERVWGTSGARLVSGMCGFGMWQQRCHQVIREAHASRLVLHLGSLMEMMESGKINGQPGVASLMRGAIDRGQLLAIAECTPEQLSIIEREDPMLLRCFSKLEIQPTDSETTRRILTKVATELAPKHVRVAPKAIDELYRLHERYSTYSAMPGQPIRLLRAMLEDCSSDESKPVVITDLDVAQRFSKDTGLPQFLLDDSVALDIEFIRDSLSSQVIGQPEPIDRIVQLITMLKARLNRSDRPLTSLLMIGPTGVGKTETAKALAKLLYRDQDRMIRIDMSEYAQPWSAARLVGAANQGDGTLTSPIRDQPFSVVLLDEFEKCHPSVLDLLLQVLGEGRLTDSSGRIADFRNAVIILTSNLGVDSFRLHSFGFGADSLVANEHFLREVKRYVRPELLGRLDQIIAYRPLSLEVVRKIADRELAEITKRSGLRYGSIVWEVDASARKVLAEMGFDPRYGARPLRREIERHIVIPLSECIEAKKNDSTLHVSFHASESNSQNSKRIECVATHGESRIDCQNEFATERGFVDQVRDLDHRARLLVQSTPFHALENKIERMSRQIDQFQKNLKQIHSHRRIQRTEFEINSLRTQMGELQKKVYALQELSQRINALHQNTMEEWYARKLVSNSSSPELLVRLEKQLRQHLIELHGQLDAKRDLQSVILLGQNLSAAEPLWQSYRRLTELNQWRAILYRICAYNPLFDPSSAAFQQREAASRQKIEIPENKLPSFRLTIPQGDSTPDQPESRKKIADVYRLNAWRELENLEAGTLGVAIQLDQGMISNWLGEEHGVHHFVTSTAEGNKRHRIRVIIKPGRLFDWEPPNGWDEVPSLMSRDPRRTFIAGERRLISHLIQHEVRVTESNPIADWVELIQLEGNKQLWRSVGYSSIPFLAT
ncbi:MAG: AAA family ATPase, partial [Pirellula sp.]